MPISPVLPVELFHEILHHLRDDKDLKTLKQCALVCSTLRYIVQQHLFSELTLHRFPLARSPTQSVPPGVKGYQQQGYNTTFCSDLLEPAHSHLLSHVRRLTLQLYPPLTTTRSIIPFPDPTFTSVLSRLPARNLSKITILRRVRDDPWPDTKEVVRRLLKRSTGLEELDLEDKYVPASYLVACARWVRVVRVYGTEFVEDVVERTGARTRAVRRWSRLETLVFPLKLLPECLLWMGTMGLMAGSGNGSGSGGGAVTFPRLKHLLIGDEAKDVEVVNGVLDMCKSTLQSLVYTPYGYNFSSYPKPCYNQNGSKMELNIPSTLRMLAINCPIMLKPASRTYPNPLGWLNHTFRQLSHNNQPCSLETVHIKFLTTPQIEKLDALFPGGFPVDLCFHEFDNVLSNKTRFPFLKKVYLTVGRHYLSLFADPGTLPLLSERRVLGIIYEEVTSVGRRFWDFGSMMGVKDLPWDGKTYSFGSLV